MVAFVKHNSFVQDLARGVFNLHTDTVKIALTNTDPSATDVYTSLASELANGSGYSTGGLTLAGQSATQTAGVLKFTATSPVLTASGAVGPLRYAYMYSNTAALKQVIGNYDYGSSITLASGDTLTFTISGSGILTVT